MEPSGPSPSTSAGLRLGSRGAVRAEWVTSMPETILISLDEALAWARGKTCLQVRLPDGGPVGMGVVQYRTLCEAQERLGAHRAKPGAVQSALRGGGQQR